MPGIDSIKARILEEAGAQAGKSLEQARAEAEEILRQGAEEAEKKRSALLTKAASDAEDRKRRLVSVAELEARKQILNTKQAVINEAFEKALERLNALPDTEYQTVLLHMISNAVRTGTEEVVLSERDQKRLSADFVRILNQQAEAKGIRPAAISLAKEAGTMKGGFVLRLGNVEVNNSFEAALKIQRERLEAEIVKVLFS